MPLTIARHCGRGSRHRRSGPLAPSLLPADVRDLYDHDGRQARLSVRS